MTLEAYLVAGIAACAGAIAHLYVRLERKNARTETRLDECEKDRAELWKRIGNTH